MSRTLWRSLLSLLAIAAVTVAAHKLLNISAITVGFLYLLTVLVIASTWGFLEAFLASVAGALCFNFFFLPPVRTFSIADPQNWVALFSFLFTALIASRLSTNAEQRARDAMERQRDLERLYSFSRAILLIDTNESFSRELTRHVVEIFGLEAALLYDRRTGETYRSGPGEFPGLDAQLRDAALGGGSYFDPKKNRSITAVRLGAEPIAGLALQGPRIPDTVLQGIGNLVAIGLERSRTQDLNHQIEAARQSEQLRTSLIDAMAHEFKTPLTSVKAATTSLLADPEQPVESRRELLSIADQEADHLRDLIDDAVEMARLDTARIEVNLELSNPADLVREVLFALHIDRDDRRIEVRDDSSAPVPMDKRLVKLALKQLIDNALKYSTPGTPVVIRLEPMAVEVLSHGKEIPAGEQRRIFDRFYRAPSVKQQIPGSGLGLSIAQSIARAHNGDLTLMSRPGETVFRISLPGPVNWVEK